MSLSSTDLFTSSSSPFTLYFAPSSPKNPSFLFLQITSRHSSHSHVSRLKLSNPSGFGSIRIRQSRIRAFDSDGTLRRNGTVSSSSFSLDSFLSVTESLCIFSSTIVAIGFALNCAVPSLKNTFFEVMGTKVLPYGVVMMVIGVGIGAWIRRRQWRRICRESVKGGLEVNLLERIEKLEEDLKSSATIIRVLSRQLEKLGIRFRVTRKALKKPIAEEDREGKFLQSKKFHSMPFEARLRIRVFDTIGLALLVGGELCPFKNLETVTEQYTFLVRQKQRYVGVLIQFFLAALAQKNSEATRALAVQGDILEKELGEIQKVLLAMQEQQQKQLELILAIGKSSKLWETRQETNKEQNKIEIHDLTEDGRRQKEAHQI